MKKSIILVAIVLLGCSSALFAQDAEYKKQQAIYVEISHFCKPRWPVRPTDDSPDPDSKS